MCYPVSLSCFFIEKGKKGEFFIEKNPNLPVASQIDSIGAFSGHQWSETGERESVLDQKEETETAPPMAGADKELEEQLLEAGNKLVDPPSSVEDLLALLEVIITPSPPSFFSSNIIILTTYFLVILF